MSLVRDSLVHNYTVFQGGPGGTDLGGEPREVPLGSDLPLDQAYAESAEVVARLGDQWQVTRAGFKISMTNTADQEPVNASEPAYGVLTTAHVVQGSQTLRLAATNSALVEPELVFRSVDRLSSAMTDDELVRAMEITAGLEIPVCRIPGWWPEGQRPAVTLSDFVRDNAAAGFVVHGDSWRPAAGVDLTDITVVLVDPSGESHQGTATRVLDNPLNAVRWLVEALGRHGQDVPLGSVIASGTFMPPRRAVAGEFTTTFSHDLGAASARFV